MTEFDKIVAKEFKEKVAQKVPIIDIRIFGSRARGDSIDDSDMDIFIETDEISREVKEIIYDIAWEVGFEKEIHISPIIFSRNEIENSPLKISPIVTNILSDGIKV